MEKRPPEEREAMKAHYPINLTAAVWNGVEWQPGVDAESRSDLSREGTVDSFPLQTTNFH